MIDALVLSGLERDALDDLADEAGDLEWPAVAIEPRLLRGDGHAVLDGERVVSGHLAADPVLERCDDLAARGVILGVRGEDQHHVQRQAYRIALNLNVAFLHDVEQTDLYLRGQVGQLVQREDPAVAAREQAIVNREFVGQ